ncbi:uncharacterized protein LOC105834609 isoform X2 [Monomorium pharaonis]|nr:uncharacterized protein LOC105834609 isoform X2 [Monomorium pharaonis]XP_028050428.1 uncharacterized protein LOC105834609 isoform X2 [Monomorium pharaonis]XP_028050431.1 uncharacterized protein LOC105834609 isoform X2 [Monomorium pharaonis]XP_036139114.1 uncharacterized protein LOC105834609 isoform X2 [Monomorium pharaonis]XP_036139115.1 uncharacterized protein LOC105834609 isoform X2 [Monomorium pharaonis]XP_036139116.1 uncharacterized protein LOC105834609 isoform X2 [Monomorium pharaonis]
MRRPMNLDHFLCCLLIVTVIGMTIVSAELEPIRLVRSDETIGSDILLQRFVDCLRNRYISAKPRHGKRSDAVPMMELNATWETLKMIQDAQRQNEQRRQQNIRQNKEQILLRDFPSLNDDEHTSYDATQYDATGSLSEEAGKYYNNVQ